MRRSRDVLVALAALALLAGGCKSAAPVAEVSVAEAAAALKAGAVFVDANTVDYRNANGKVPGAIALADYRLYPVAETLPEKKDKQLIFYCTSRL